MYYPYMVHIKYPLPAPILYNGEVVCGLVVGMHEPSVDMGMLIVHLHPHHHHPLHRILPRDPTMERWSVVLWWPEPSVDMGM